MVLLPRFFFFFFSFFLYYLTEHIETPFVISLCESVDGKFGMVLMEAFWDLGDSDFTIGTFISRLSIVCSFCPVLRLLVILFYFILLYSFYRLRF